MREYLIEDKELVDLIKLRAQRMPDEPYQEAHKGLVIPCHDVFINYHGGILLIERTDPPAKGELMPAGGRMSRGMLTEDSLQAKVKEETGLILEEITDIGHARTFFREDPFNHGFGTDTFNIIYYARGEGDLKLDATCQIPVIVSPSEYRAELRKGLHPYVQDFMDLAMPLLRFDLFKEQVRKPLSLNELLLAEDKESVIRYLFEDNEKKTERIYTDDQTKLPVKRKLYDLVLEQTDPERNIYIILDIDRFKDFNTLYGHLKADHGKIALAGLLRQEVDELNRNLGYPVLVNNRNFMNETNEAYQFTQGDEFCIKLYGLSLAEGVAFADSLRKAVEFSFQRENGGLTISLGVAQHVPAVGDKKRELETALNNADMQLFIAKRHGRNQVGNLCPQALT